MKRRYLLILILLLYTALFCPALSLKENITAKGTEITLGDLFSDIQGKHSDVYVASTGMPGTVKKVSASYINQILMRHSLPLLDLEKMTYVNVNIFSYPLKAGIITEYLRENYRLSYPLLVDYDEIMLTTDEFEMEFSEMGSQRFILEVITKKKKKLLRKIVIRYMERLMSEVLVTSENISSGTYLDENMFRVMNNLIPADGSEPVRSMSDLRHCMAASDIARGTVLLKNMIEYADIVSKGSVVTAVQRGEGYNVVIRLKALQDGHYDQIINLKGLDNRRKYQGRVVDENKVELIN